MLIINDINDLHTLDNRPAPTETWEPVSHLDFTSMLLRNLTMAGFQVDNPRIELTHGKVPASAGPDAGLKVRWANMFATAEILHFDVANPLGVRTMLGWRNSHVQKMAMGIGVGTRVVVCSNMDFSADRKLNQRHTTGSFGKAEEALTKLIESKWIQNSMRTRNSEVRLAKNTLVTDEWFRRYTEKVIVEQKVLPSSKYTKLVDLWNNYNKEDFAVGTKWRAFNCVTELLKDLPQATVADRTRRLHAIA